MKCIIIVPVVDYHIRLEDISSNLREWKIYLPIFQDWKISKTSEDFAKSAVLVYLYNQFYFRFQTLFDLVSQKFIQITCSDISLGLNA